MTRNLVALVGLLPLVSLSNTAQAGGFHVKTMRDPLSARLVDRGLVLGKGWLEFELSNDYKDATGAWDSNGNPVDWEHAAWTYTTQTFAIRYGITRRAELLWLGRTHYARLTNDQLGTDISRFGVGDPEVGYTYEVWHSMAPTRSLIAYGLYKGSAGNEAPGNYVGGPDTWTNIVFTTGTPDLTLGARYKHQIGPLALTGGAAYVRRFSEVVQYAVETKNNQFQLRIKPGDEQIYDGQLLVQTGPIAWYADAILALRALTKVGHTTAGLFPAKDLTPVADSDGWELDLRPGLTLDLSRGVDVAALVDIPLRGEDLQFFPIEDLQPTRGLTWTGTVKFRY